jgi:hypothetical protein
MLERGRCKAYKKKIEMHSQIFVNIYKLINYSLTIKHSNTLHKYFYHKTSPKIILKEIWSTIFNRNEAAMNGYFDASFYSLAIREGK